LFLHLIGFRAFPLLAIGYEIVTSALQNDSCAPLAV